MTKSLSHIAAVRQAMNTLYPFVAAWKMLSEIERDLNATTFSDPED